jgi:Zn-finger nucleic acid-binding protein
MDCPRCKTPQVLGEQQIDEGGVLAPTLECPNCHGHLFHKQDLERIEETVVLKPFERQAQIPTIRTQLKALRCPRCEKHPYMRKVSNRRHEEVVTDVCPECESVWLDGGELERIREAGLLATVVQCLKWFRE